MTRMLTRIMPRLSRRELLVAGLLAPLSPRSARAAGDAIDVGAIGRLGNGTADATAALNTLFAGVGRGGTVRLPPGRYRVTGTVFLRSGTTVIGPGATIVGGEQWVETPAARKWLSPGRAMIANMNHAAGDVIDHDINLDGLAFEYVGPTHGEAHAVRFRKARNIVVTRCSFKGGGDGTAFLACRRTEVASCTTRDAVNCAYDHWEGTSDSIVRDCRAGGVSEYGILFTGVGTDPDDHQVAQRMVAENNVIEGALRAGIWVNSLSPRSWVGDVTLRRNIVRVGDSGAAGIGSTGDVRGLRIEDNIVEHTRGGAAIFTRPDQWNRPRGIRITSNRMRDCETNAANMGMIQALGDDVVVEGNLAESSRYHALVAVDGGGVRLGDNRATNSSGRFKYDATRAKSPMVADPR